MFRKLALIALLLLVVSPTMAYSLLYTYDISDQISTHTEGMPNNDFYIYVRDAPGFTNVTHIEVTNVAGYKSGNLTASGNNCALIGTDGFSHGTANVSYIWNALGTYTARGSYTIDIDSFDPLGNVGSKAYRFECAPPVVNNAILYDMASQFPASPWLPSDYAAVPSNNGNAVLNATYSFFNGVANVTPPTPGPANTTVRTYVRAIDGTSGAWVVGANVAIRNEQTGNWTNATATPDGSHYIDLYSNQTLAGYVSGTGYTGGSRVGMAAWDGVYEIPMYALGTLLPPGVGEVSVVVQVQDQTSKVNIIGAHVDYTKSTGATEGYSTGSSGTANFLAPNLSTINIKISKDGYTGVSKAITTSAFGPDYVLIWLPKVQATPSVTATIPGDNNHDGVVDEKDSVPGVTPIVTEDPRTPLQKDQAAMDQLRNALPVIIGLAIIVIIFGLLKMLLKW